MSSFRPPLAKVGPTPMFSFMEDPQDRPIELFIFFFSAVQGLITGKHKGIKEDNYAPIEHYWTEKLSRYSVDVCFTRWKDIYHA